MLFSNAVRNGLNLTAKRFIRKKVIMKSWPNDWVPFFWSRPEKIPSYYNSGDLEEFGQPKRDEIHPEFDLSQELKGLSIEDDLRKIFSLDHAKRSHFNKARVYQHKKPMGLVHEIDFDNSLEAKIISATYTFRHLLARVKESEAKEEGPRFNAHIKHKANDIQHRRYSYLCQLKELHTERYERIIKELNIAPKPNLINVKQVQPFRKTQMRALAIQYARDLKEKKVEEFMQSLAKEKEQFEMEKAETLKWIEEKEKELGVTV